MWNNVSNYTRDNVSYSYQDCVHRDASPLIDKCIQLADSTNQSQQCVQFCGGFPEVLPWIYLSFSCLSALCCLAVFVSYYLIPKLRHSGHSTKVFLLRTLMDFIIALGHIFAGIFHLAEVQNANSVNGCTTIAIFNQIALFASNCWYVLLAVDLLKAIMNPFSARPTYGVASHVVIWSMSIISGVVLALLLLPDAQGGPGPSMFFWCWVSIESTEIKKFDRVSPLSSFAVASLGFYQLWVTLFWLFSVCCIIIGKYILQRRLATSSETRRLVIRQNLWYVLSLGLETSIVIVIWIIQLSIISSYQADTNKPFFFTYVDFGLAITFAIVHSFRGTIDLFVWKIALGISFSDISDLFKRLRDKNRKDMCVSKKSLKTPLLASKSGDSQVNKALRRNAMYCINIGILDAVQLHLQYIGKIKRVGSVRDRFVADQMIKLDEENQVQEREELYKEDPARSERSIRRLQFPATATIQSFSFVDLEPSIFSLLRTTFGITPKKYRESFKIRNAADIDKEGMLEKFTEGKSGSFFYFTRDFRYIIKTVTTEEEKFLQKIAYKYYHHMQNNPDSLIARFYGLHKVKLAPEQRYITVVVMDNIFHNKEHLSMHERYDLKGSWVGRRSIKGSRERNAYKGTLKDLDLGDKKIWVGTENKQILISQLKEDAQFLASCDIMDYSMLLGVHNHSKFGERSMGRPEEQNIAGIVGEDFIDVSIKVRPSAPPPGHKHMSSGYGTDTREPEIRPVRTGARNTLKRLTIEENETTLTSTTQYIGVPWFREDYGGLRSCSPMHPRCSELETAPSTLQGGEPPVATYYFGIIDILQEYNLRKKIEHQWKTKVQCQDKHGLSAVNPRDYAQRFGDFMETIFV